jgi:hypothetical protein
MHQQAFLFVFVKEFGILMYHRHFFVVAAFLIVGWRLIQMLQYTSFLSELPFYFPSPLLIILNPTSNYCNLESRQI